MNPTAIFSKTGKGVQEASGKTSDLSRADRAVLKEIDGKTALATVALKFDKLSADKFDALITQFDKGGYIREVSSGSQPAASSPARSAAPPKAAPPPAASGGDDEMDFTQAIKLPPPAAPKPPTLDLAAASRAEAERKEKEQQAFNYKARQEAELKAKAQADARAKAEAETRARALTEAKARAESEAKAKTEAEARARAAAAATEAKTLAEAEAKVKAAREAAIRMATEVKAKAEAEGKARTDAAEGREREALEKARKESEDKARMEAELKGKLEEERKAREDAERRAREAADQARKEFEEKARRDADELRQRLEAEMKAKLDEERKAREEEDRKRREEENRKRAEEDRKRREEDDRRRKEEQERRAKEEAERKAREEEDRKRREEDARHRKEEDDRRAKEEAERRAQEEAERNAERKRREEDDRKRADEEKRRKDEDGRRAKEDADRRARDEADRKARDEADRKARDEADRKARDDADARARAAQVALAQSSSAPSIPPVVTPPPPPPAAAAGGLDESLLADLDSFGKREEEEQKAKEEAERKAKEDAARKAKAEADRRATEEADRRAKEEAEKKRIEEEQRKAKEEAEQRAREDEERQKQEEAERKRKAKEALAAKESERKGAQRAAAAKTSATGQANDDIDVSDDDLDMDDVKRDEKALSATARKAAREREHSTTTMAAVGRPRKWGKPAAIALFLIMIVGVFALQLMPISTTEYEKAASDAMGVPVKIGSARLSVITGIEVKFEGVSIGDSVKIKTVRGYPEVGSLFGGRKSFSRIDLEGVSLSQSQLADAVLGKVSGENFRVARIMIKQAKLDGPLALPALDVDAAVSGDGSLQSIALRGGDKLSVQLSPKGSEIGFEISAGSLALPFVPALNLSEFSMKGTANRAGVTSSEFDGRAFDGVISGSAKIRWGANWVVDGEVRARGLKVAVLAPALVSEGKADGRGAYSMSGANPATLSESARIQGEFKIDKGVLGSFDLTRALQTGGTQSSGRTVFSELTGQALYDKGTVKITNAAISAGAMNAGVSLDIDASGGLSGRVVADVKTPNQTLRATLNISGKIQDPVIRK